MSAIWSLKLGSRTLDVTAPVVGLLATVCLLVAFHDPHARAAETPVRVIAPDARGTVVGVVQDGHGDPVPGARVQVVGEEGETLFEAKTATETRDGLALGEFRIDQLPSGHYTLRAVLADASSPAIRVPVSSWEDTRVRLHVDLGY